MDANLQDLSTELDGGPPDAEALRAAYEIESRRRTRRGAITYCLVGAAIDLASAPLDHVRFPAEAGTLLVMRIAGAAGFLAVAAALRTRWGDRYPRPLALLVPTVGAGLLVALGSITGREASAINASMNFVMLGAAVLIPWPATWTALACMIGIGEFVGGMLAAEGTAVGAAFVDNVSVFTATFAIAVGITVALERRRAREFAQQWALAGAHRRAGASAARYRSVVETAGSVIIVLAADGRVSELNHEADRVLGWARAELIGRPYLDLCVPEVHAPVRAAIASALAGDPVRALEVRMATRDGAECVLVCNASRLLGTEGEPVRIIVSGQDITDRKRVEQALRDSENRLRTVVGNAPVVLFTIDRAGVITLAEGRGLARFGLVPGAVVGRQVADVMTQFGVDAAVYAGYFAQALAGEEPTWVGAGAGATFECRLTPMRDARGRITGVIGVAIDVTERREADEARLTLERKLLEGQKLESLGVLAGGVAHDFSNLLVTVLGNLHLALEELPADSPVRPVLKRIETAARRGSDLTRQMLAYAGKGSVMRERVDLNAIVEEMKDLLQVSMRRRATVRYELAEGLPAIQADPTQMRQVMMNLILNASDAVGDQEGAIAVRTGLAGVGEADLEAAQHAADAAPGPHVYLEIADTGCGMDAATMARIFDPFFSTKLVGRGLGLATVLGAVRGHRGVLRVSSEPADGTTFRIFLPCPDAAVDAEATAGEPSATVANGTEARTVLLVDDEEDVRAVTAHMLERLGWKVLLAADGREGVEVFRAQVQVIDAVILDLTLPRLSGEHAVREIHGISPDARVILMSGYSEEIVARRIADVELAGFLRKPFSVAELRATVDRALTPSAAPAARN